MTALVIGIAEADGEALLEELFTYLYPADEIYEHRWSAGDIIVWDNLAVQHARSAVKGGTRTLQRVTIARFGYWEQYPVDLATFEELHEVKNRTA